MFVCVLGQMVVVTTIRAGYPTKYQEQRGHAAVTAGRRGGLETWRDRLKSTSRQCRHCLLTEKKVDGYL